MFGYRWNQEKFGIGRGEKEAMASENFGKNESEKISRRTFLKMLTGTAAGVAVTLALPTVSKAENVIENINGQFDLEGGVTYIDSLGRRVTVASNIQKVIPAGMIAQTVLEMLCPEKLQYTTQELENENNRLLIKGTEPLLHISKKVNLHNSKLRNRLMNELDESDGDLIIDMGDLENISLDDYAEIQSGTGMPVLFLDAKVGNLSSSIIALGKILNCKERAEEFSDFIDEVYDIFNHTNESINSNINVLFAADAYGTANRPGYQYQNEVIRKLGYNPVVALDKLDDEEINIDKVIQMDVDFIFLSEWDTYNCILNKESSYYEIWEGVNAVKNGKYAVAPGIFHSWLGSAVLVQIIGIAWMAYIIEPSNYNFDMVQLTIKFYELFYNYVLTEEEAKKLIGIN